MKKYDYNTYIVCFDYELDSVKEAQFLLAKNLQDFNNSQYYNPEINSSNYKTLQKDTLKNN